MKIETNILLSEVARCLCGTKLLIKCMKGLCDPALKQILELESSDKSVDKVLHLMDLYADQNGLDYREIRREENYRKEQEV